MDHSSQIEARQPRAPKSSNSIRRAPEPGSSGSTSSAVRGLPAAGAARLPAAALRLAETESRRGCRRNAINTAENGSPLPNRQFTGQQVSPQLAFVNFLSSDHAPGAHDGARGSILLMRADTHSARRRHPGTLKQLCGLGPPGLWRVFEASPRYRRRPRVSVGVLSKIWCPGVSSRLIVLGPA